MKKIREIKNMGKMKKIYMIKIRRILKREIGEIKKIGENYIEKIRRI